MVRNVWSRSHGQPCLGSRNHAITASRRSNGSRGNESGVGLGGLLSVIRVIQLSYNIYYDKYTFPNKSKALPRDSQVISKKCHELEAADRIARRHTEREQHALLRIVRVLPHQVEYLAGLAVAVRLRGVLVDDQECAVAELARLGVD